MGSIIFLPGILGSELFLNGEEVWPPTPWEAKFGYDRVDKLIDPNVKAGKPIEAVLCFNFYKQISKDLQDIASGNAGAPKRSFHSYGYDWRIDLRDIAKDIATRIETLPAGDTDHIVFVGHSMGCLVIRLILESGLYNGRPWFEAVKSFTALAGPHLGAPTALVRVMGLEGTVGLAPADIKRIAADPRYPALYQLLPAPGIAAVWNAKGGAVAKLDLYDKAVAKTLGLNIVNLAKTLAVHKILAKNNHPNHVEYIYLAGSGNDTWLRVDLSGTRPDARMGKDAGDGTVPLWSAVNPACVHHVAPAVHESVFRNEQIRMLIYRSLGARPPAIAFASARGKPLLSIFAAQTIYSLRTPIELMIVPVNPAKRVSGDLVVEYSDGTDDPKFEPFARQPLVYDGVEVEQLNVRLEPPPRSGFYKVTFDGSHDTAPDGAAMFGISEVGGGAGG
jgi:phospholipase A1